MAPTALPILIVLIVIGVPVVCGTLIALAAILRGGSKKNERQEAEETRLIQELHQGMNRLEARIEAIETILMDQEQHKENLR